MLAIFFERALLNYEGFFSQLQACPVNEEPLQVPDSKTDQAKLLLELQKENSELRQQLAQQKQKLLMLQAQSLAANNASPAPSPATSVLMSPPPSSQRRVKRSILSGACFSTPEPKKRGATDAIARELQDRVKALEMELERVKKEHRLQIKQKDDFIRELITKNNLRPLEGGEDREKRIVTRASLRKAERSVTAGELKSPSHRFLSPLPTAKKRSFWDITAANSPSVISVNGRKIKSHVAAATPAAPSMLLQV